MFRCFKLDIQNTDFFDQNQEYIKEYENHGEQLSSIWFPIVKKMYLFHMHILMKI